MFKYAHDFNAGFVTKFMTSFYLQNMPILSRLKNSPDLWQNITLQYAHDFKAGFVTKFMANRSFFLMAVYMIFKYSKRFRFAPSFNNSIVVTIILVIMTVVCSLCSSRLLSISFTIYELFSFFFQTSTFLRLSLLFLQENIRG